MKVKATEMYKKLNIQDEQLKRIPEAGEEFEVSGERYEVLTKTNKYNVVFVEAVEKVREPIETAKKEVKTEKAVKKTTKKAK